MRWMGLLFSLVICFTVAGLGGRWTAGEVTGWYQRLERPTIAPPNWVFGPAWTLLYALMAVAAWRVWLTTPSAARSWALWLFVAQLALNLAWSWIFFQRHEIGLALAELILLWAAIGATTIAFGQVTASAAWLMAPYWAWVSFGAVLNAAYWRLNRG